MSLLRKTFVSLAFLLAFLPSQAQVPTGQYPFGTFDTLGPETIDVSDLNLMLNIPVFHKPGRAGTDFNYNLVYNGAIWTPGSTTSTTWIPAQNWGWLSNTATLAGYISESQTSGLCAAIGGGRAGWNRIQGVIYYDPQGTAHKFNGFYRTSIPPGCTTGDGDTLSNSWSLDHQYEIGSADDGFPLTDIRGNIIKAPMGVTTGPATYTDRNGNKITTDGSGHFTDTTGNVVLTAAGVAPSNQTYTYTDATGTSRAVTVSYATYNVATNFGCSGVTEYTGSSVPLVDRITFPDASYYAFTYEATPGVSGKVTGRLASITVPSGGVITYAYSGSNNGINCADGSTLALSRTLSTATSGLTSAVRTYTRTVSGTDSHNLVVDGLGNHFDYDFVSTLQTALSVTAGGTGTPLLAQQTCYNGASVPCTTTAITSALTSMDQYQTWDGIVQNGSSTTFDINSNPLKIYTYDFGTSTARGGQLQYRSLDYYGPFVQGDLLAQSDTGAAISKTEYTYDSPALPLTVTSGVPQHNTAVGNFGNLNGIGISPNGIIAATGLAQFTYDDTGTVLTYTGLNAPVTYSYESTNTFPTTTGTADPNSVGMSSTATFDVTHIGARLTSTDSNGTVTSMPTSDAYGRPTEIDVKQGGTTLVSKSTYSYTPTKTSVITYQSSSISGESDTYYDPYGRPMQSATQSASGNWYVSDTCYDANGHVAFQSYPYSTSTPGTPVCTGTPAGDSTIYDALGRPLQIQHADTGSTKTQFLYLGNETKKTDENNVVHLYRADALGRTTIACEVSTETLAGVAPSDCGTTAFTANGFATTYDFTSALRGVIVTQGAQTREFLYDPFERLTAKCEPESMGNCTGEGPRTIYGYSVTPPYTITRQTELANQTNTSLHTTTTTVYDSLYRPISISYDDGITPTKTFTYDVAPSGSGFSVGYAKGRMTSASTGSSGATTLFAYDALGRVTSTQQCIPGWCSTSTKNINRSYTYDWASNPATEQYNYSSSGTSTLTYGVNLAGQLTSITGGQDSSVASSLYSVTGLSPNGPTAVSLGNGLTGALTYDVFGRQKSATWPATGTPVYSYTATWAGQRVTASTDTVNGTGSYTYDTLGRLSTTSLASLSLGWTYDRYGNRLSQTASGTYAGGTVSQPSLTVDPTSNQITTSGYTYDAAGNLSSDGAYNYAYDAEGNLTTVTSGGSTVASYTFDALNQRVMDTVGGVTQAYGFDLSGNRATVWDSSANMLSAQYNAADAYYLVSDSHVHFQHQDWTGTERFRSTYTGTLDGSFTSLPFGDGLTTASGTDTDAYHFAMLDADSTDLQHATFREYSAVQGRWLRPDPYDGSYDYTDPQSLNRYAYVNNSPLAYVDPLGLDHWEGNCFVSVTSGWSGNNYVVNASAQCFQNTGLGPQPPILVNPGPPSGPGRGGAPITAMVGPNPNGCAKKTATDVVKGAIYYDQVSWLAGKLADGLFGGTGASSPTAASGLPSIPGSSTISAASSTASFIAGSQIAQGYIRQAIRAGGGTISVRRVGKLAGGLGKYGGVIGSALTAYSAYQDYQYCMGR